MMVKPIVVPVLILEIHSLYSTESSSPQIQNVSSFSPS